MPDDGRKARVVAIADPEVAELVAHRAAERARRLGVRGRDPVPDHARLLAGLDVIRDLIASGYREQASSVARLLGDLMTEAPQRWDPLDGLGQSGVDGGGNVFGSPHVRNRGDDRLDWTDFSPTDIGGFSSAQDRPPGMLRRISPAPTSPPTIVDYTYTFYGMEGRPDDRYTDNAGSDSYVTGQSQPEPGPGDTIDPPANYPMVVNLSYVGAGALGDPRGGGGARDLGDPTGGSSAGGADSPGGSGGARDLGDPSPSPSQPGEAESDPALRAIAAALLRALGRSDLLMWGGPLRTRGTRERPPADPSGQPAGATTARIRPRGLADEPVYSSSKPSLLNRGEVIRRMWGGHGPRPR